MTQNSWKTASSGDWSTATNWSTGTIAGGTDTAFILAPGISYYTVTISTPEAAQTLDLASYEATLLIEAPFTPANLIASAGTLAIAAGDNLTVAGAVTLGQASSSGPTIDGPGTLTTNGATNIAAQTGYSYTDLYRFLAVWCWSNHANAGSCMSSFPAMR